jgi:hypothetical protein
MVCAGKTEWQVPHYILYLTTQYSCCSALHHFCVTVSLTSPNDTKSTSQRYSIIQIFFLLLPWAAPLPRNCDMENVHFLRCVLCDDESNTLYLNFINSCFRYITAGHHSSVGIATCYGLDVLGSNPGVGRDFLHPYRTVLGPTQPPIQWVPGLSWG